MAQPWAIGVFTSVDQGLGADLGAVKGLDIETVQLHAPSSETRRRPRQVKQQFDDAGIQITCVFCGFAGESYASIPVVKETVGLVPEATHDERLAETKAIADFAAELGVPAVGMHIGFVPEDEDDPIFRRVVNAAQTVCDYIGQYDQGFHLETGQETAPALLRFFQAVDRSNLAINFDPANMVLYGSGKPIDALRQVGRHVKSVHCKDGKWSDQPGETWGVETPLGQGDVGLERFLQTLKEVGYGGPLTIEREIGGPEQIRDIREAVELLKGLRAKLLP